MIVLAATDGQPHSDKAVETGISYSKAFDAKLYVVYVVAPKNDENRTRDLKNGIKALERAKAQGSDEGVQVVAMMEAGDASKVILDVGDEIGADVLVVGASPQRGISLLSRPLSEQVVRDALCTVIVAR
jgi:nucleotide-binding universal stress UspA family protein